MNKTLSQNDYSDHCKNNTGVKVTAENQQGNPNGTSSATPTSSNGTGTGSGSGSTPSPHSAGNHVTAASWLLGAAGLVGFAFL